MKRVVLGAFAGLILLAGSLVAASADAETTIAVTKTADSFDGTCNTDCSLREAIAEANSDPDFDQIDLPNGVFALTVPGPGDIAQGDLDINESVAIAGASSTHIKGGPGWADRIFEVFGGATVHLISLTISGGNVPETGGTIDNGGAIRSVGPLVLFGVRLEDNHAGDDGGAIRSLGQLLVSRSELRSNTAESGGAIHHTGGGGLVQIFESILDDNHATDEGGAVAVGGVLQIVRSILSDNSAHDGGAIAALAGSELRSTATTITGNHADGYGGGVMQFDGLTVLRSTTITANTADHEDNLIGNGGGVAHFLGTMEIVASIVASNTDASSASDDFPDCAGAVTSHGYNVFGSTSGCALSGAQTDDHVGVAFIGPLRFNGGPTETHALSVLLSPALGRVPASDPSCTSTQDQRGLPRNLGGDCDSGAYELMFCESRVVNVVGTDNADQLEGTNGADGVLGLGGNDNIQTFSGDDAVCAGSGNDEVRGGDGNDSLFGEAGKDKLYGDAGTDTFTGGPGKDKCAADGVKLKACK